MLCRWAARRKPLKPEPVVCRTCCCFSWCYDMSDEQCCAAMHTSRLKIKAAMLQVAPVLDHQPLDLWGLFHMVAAYGGYQAVSARRCHVTSERTCCSTEWWTSQRKTAVCTTSAAPFCWTLTK